MKLLGHVRRLVFCGAERMWRRTLRQGSGWSDFQGVLLEGSACSVEGGLEGQGSERWESVV